MLKIVHKQYSPDFVSPTGGSFTTFGSPSKTIVLATEEDKIAIEFAAAAAIKEGQPVKLDATGKVAIWAKADGRSSLLGFALMDAASGALVTIETRGYALLYGISAAAQASGLATINGYDTTTDVGGTKGYNTIGITATDTEMIGWALDVAAGAGQLIRFLVRD